MTSDDWLTFSKREDWLKKAPGAIAVYENSKYIVEEWPCIADCGYSTRLVIRRFDKEPIHSWTDFQRIKSEIAGPEKVAIEIYPPESELTDTANIYHLWVISEGVEIPVTLIPPIKP